jgi:hypothetical protein
VVNGLRRTASVGKYCEISYAIAVQVEAMVDLPKKFSNLDEMNRGWTARVKAETDFNESIEKPSAVRSVPEAVTT